MNKINQFRLGGAAAICLLPRYKALNLTFSVDIGNLTLDGTINSEMGHETISTGRPCSVQITKLNRTENGLAYLAWGRSLGVRGSLETFSVSGWKCLVYRWPDLQLATICAFCLWGLFSTSSTTHLWPCLSFNGIVTAHLEQFMFKMSLTENQY